MKINKKHPLYKMNLIVGQQITHNGLTYNIVDEELDHYELEPERLCSWKGRTCY